MTTRERFDDTPTHDPPPSSSPLKGIRKFVIASISLIVLIIITPPGVRCFFIDNHQSPSAHQWSYHAQDDWRLERGQCAGSSQSPIDIQRENVRPNSRLKLHFYNYNSYVRFTIHNAHHTIKLNPIDTWSRDSKLKLASYRSANSSSVRLNNAAGNEPPIVGADDEMEPEASETEHLDARHHQSRIPTSTATSSVTLTSSSTESSGVENASSSTVETMSVAARESSATNELPAYNGAPTIKLDWLDDDNNVFRLADIHFHWADRRDNGSEHAIDGRRAAMEMHLVHIKNDLDKSKVSYTSDSIAVIAILIESNRKSNADFNPIVNALSRINNTDQPQEVEYKSINVMLPYDLGSFYTYSGSLTTPPCYQVVNWIVMSKTLSMNAKQIELFRNLYAPQKHSMRLSAAPPSDREHEQIDNSAASSMIEEPAPIMPNIRQLQPLNNRIILASFDQGDPSGARYYTGSAGSLVGCGGLSRLVLLTLIPLASLLILMDELQTTSRRDRWRHLRN